MTPTLFYIPQIKFGISFIYLICWTFILGVSLYVFPPSFEYTLIFFHNMLENLINEEPFSLSQMYEQPSIQNFVNVTSINEK